ncbi:3-keto-disaccharide hydrolase [Flavisolibacter tropicus]|uniref:Glycosyl hydrolase n=1 Tax=Flavisolibacter tropicus TaxID=1492898 RepID=A0A172TRA7_9BACT|nr:DUF1080 domain-containing protein [Flavisolibacter tropicus]ANE49605.1 glycosyl hydrolase [Flavisolibacter tropicus]
MYKLLLIIMASSIMACHSSKKATMDSTSSPSENSGWITLFDGRDLNGWHSYGKSTPGAAWKISDNAIYLDKSNKEAGGDLVTNEEFENFDLKLEWKISPKGNSGIIFYINEDTKYTSTWNTGPEMQVLDNGTESQDGHPDAKITKHRAGDLYDLITSKEAIKPVGEWNEVEVIANKGKLDFYMNGQHTLSTTMWDDQWRSMIAGSKFKDMPAFGTFKKGKIALQDHGDNVWYRNIRIKRL